MKSFFPCFLLFVSLIATVHPIRVSAQSRAFGAGSFVVDDSHGHTITLQAPPGMGGSYMYTLPPPPGGSIMSGYVQMGSSVGQTLYWNGNYWAPTATGMSGQVLQLDGSGIPAWVTVPGAAAVTSVDVSGGATGLTTSGGPVTTSGTITLSGTLALGNGGTGAATQAAAINNLLPSQAGNNGEVLMTDGSNVSWQASFGSGTVTSISLAAPAEFTVSGSPITTSGTLTLTKANENANAVFAGPTSGAAAAPAFRALVSADIPDNGANTTGSAGSFTGALSGDVSGTQSATVVSTVGTSSAANIHAAEIAANAATNANTASTIVKRDGSGNFSAGTITANLSGNAISSTTSTNFSGTLAGDVTGTQSATVVSTVGTSSAANVHSAEVAANAATNANTASTIVKRDGSGNFSAGTITANLSGNATSSTTSTNFSASLSGDVTGTQSATVVATVDGSTAANVHSAEVAANAATNANTASTIVKRDGSGNFSAGTITAGLTGNVTGNVSGTASNVTGTVAIANGGTGQSTANAGLNALLPTQTGNSGKVLQTDGSNTSWQAVGGTGTVTSVDVSGGTTGLTTSGGPITGSGAITLSGTLALANGGTGATTQPTALNNLLPSQGSNSGKFLETDGSNASWQTVSGSGTVTSVALAAPAEFTVSGSPITTSGTLTIMKANENVNTVYAGPSSGGAAQPGFRTLVSADIPNNAANTAGTASGFTGALSGDVTGTQSSTVVATVGGSTAANIHAAELAANAATNLNTASTIVKRDASGNFSAGTITAALSGNATTATSATNFSGSLSGDVTGPQGTTVVATVDGSTAANVHAAELAANAATSASTASTIVERDASGNFSAGTITAALSGNATTATSATNFSGSLSGDVTGPQGTTVVATVGGSTAANIHAAELAANAATNLNTASTIVKRDASGNFSAGTITAALSGNATTATSSTNFSGSLSGDVTGPQGTTVVATVGGSTAANIHAAELAANAATNLNTASTIVTRDASGNFSAGTITAALSGNATNVTGTVAVANGGTGATTQSSAINNLLPSQGGNSGKVLETDGSNASWQAVSGAGTVTSVALAAPTEFTVSGSPITTSGTLTLSKANENANTVYAGPTSGSAAQPGFRAIVAADIPTLNQNTTGTAANVTGTVAVANGGTGTMSYTAGDLLYASSSSALSKLSVSSSPDGDVLTLSGGLPTWQSSGGGGGGWGLAGNAISSGNFLGTTNAQDLVFKTNGTEHARVTSAGNVGIGTSAPGSAFEVANGNIAVTNTNNTAGELRMSEPSSHGAHYTSFKAQNQNASVTYTLPAAGSSTAGDVLTNNGSNTLSWAQPIPPGMVVTFNNDSNHAGFTYLATSTITTGSGAWVQDSSMDTGLEELCAAGIGGKLYTIGGYSEDSYTSSNELAAYDTATGLWTEKAGMNEAREEFTAVALGGKIYAIQGYNENDYALDSLEVYDTGTDTWTIKTSAPNYDYGTAAAAGSDGKIYVMGGDYYPSAFLQYDPSSDSWTILTDLTSAQSRYGAAAVAIDSFIYLIGGYGNIWPYYLTRVDVYNVNSGVWTTAASMHDSRYFFQATVANRHIYVAGCDGGSAEGTPNVEAYDPATNTWTSISPSPDAIEDQPGVAAVGSKVFMVGGYDESNYNYNNVFELTPPKYIYLNYFSKN